MNRQLATLDARIRNTLADPTKIRYLLAGAWNTFLGYIAGLALYYGLEGRIHVVTVGVMANIFAITMAFMTYKLFVFRTKGNWLGEYFRAYLVYGATGVMSIGLLWLLVGGLELPFWLGQGMAIILTVVASYIFHARFTFKVSGVGPVPRQ